MGAISKELMKLGSKELTKSAGKETSKAVSKAISKEVTKAVSKAAAKEAGKSVGKAITSSLTKSLAPKAGSTLDGILGKSSGITLPEPKITPITLAQRTESALGKPLNSIGSVMDDMDLTMADLKAEKLLSKKNLANLEKSTREIADINNLSLDNVGVKSKSELPMLNRTQYYDDTLGQVGKNGVRRADVPDYMQKHLSDPNNALDKFSRGSNDEILRDLFQDQTSPISELYERYDQIASGGNSRDIFTPENVDLGVAMEGKNGNAMTQDFADRTFGNKRDIAISGGSSPAKDIKVRRAVADTGVDVAMDAPSSELGSKIANLREELQTATGGSGMRGGGVPTSTASPDYGGLGESGFVNNMGSNADRPITVVAGDGGIGATPQQKGQRFLRDKTLKENLNTNSRQFADLMGKSRSYGGHYETIADRVKAENISLANVAQKTEAMINHIEGIKADAFQMADELGLKVDLSNIDNTMGLRPFQKKQLSEVGLNLNDMVGDKMVSAQEADDIYRILKGYAYDLQGSEKPLEKQAGKILNKAADTVSERMDNVLDNMGVNYKKEFLDGAGIGGVGADGGYLRSINESSKPFKFSDLRREESDWISIGKTAGNKMKEEKVPESFAEAIGQAFKKGGEKARERYYERQASGAGFGGATGGSGNGVNFVSPEGKTGMLGGLLGKAKNTGLVGAGILGGLMLGGGGGGTPSGNDFAVPEMEEDTSEPAIDPYESMSIGGYNYQQLEDGYTAALMAGDTEAAKLIGNMISMLTDKIDRYNKQMESSADKSGIASKQKAALNVLSGLMQNYEAQGPIGGNITGFLNSLTGGGYNPTAYAYSTGAEGSLGTVIKALGDTGALSEGDQARARKLMPQITDSPEAAKAKYQQLMQIIRSAGLQ